MQRNKGKYAPMKKQGIKVIANAMKDLNKKIMAIKDSNYKEKGKKIYESFKKFKKQNENHNKTVKSNNTLFICHFFLFASNFWTIIPRNPPWTAQGSGRE